MQEMPSVDGPAISYSDVTVSCCQVKSAVRIAVGSAIESRNVQNSNRCRTSKRRPSAAKIISLLAQPTGNKTAAWPAQ